MLFRSVKVNCLSFGVIALSTYVRQESIFIFFIMCAFFWVRFSNKKKKTIFTFFICILIFFSVLAPIQMYRYHAAGKDGVFSRISESWIQVNNSNQPALFVYSNGIITFFKFLLWVQVPVFFMALPLGMVLIFKKIDIYKLFMIACSISLAIPAIYGYSVNALDTRYLYFQYIFFCILFTIGTKRICDFSIKKNLIMLLFCCAIITSSILFINLKLDNHHQREAYGVSKFIIAKTDGINSYYPESDFLQPAQLDSKWPISSSQVKFKLKVKDIKDYNSFEQYLKDSRKDGVNYILVDNNSKRPDFIKNIYNNDTNFPMLKKIYDFSNNTSYKGKIYEIRHS
mgnify:CR=1 FL=1